MQAGQPPERFAEARTRRGHMIDTDLTGATPLQLATLCGEAEAAAFLLQASPTSRCAGLLGQSGPPPLQRTRPPAHPLPTAAAGGR